MREIKFKVWDKHYERWEERPCSISKRGVLFIYNVDSGDWFEPSHTGYEVVWFTGIKDKNGTEAYQGDKIAVRDGDYKAMGIVIWCKEAGQWMWEAVDASNAMTIAKGQTGPLWKILDKQSRYQGEIIGNIHQEKDNDPADSR